MADTQQTLNRALILHRAGSIAEAATIYRQVLAAEPANADALHLLGLALKSEGRLDEALASIEKAVALRPDFADAIYNLGNTLGGLGRREEAVASFRRAVAINPGLAIANYNLGNTLRDMGDLEDASDAFRAALTAQPDYAEARHNLANVLKGLNQVDAAIAAYRETIARKPDLNEAHYNLGLALLLTGDLEEGLEKYEYRWAVDGFPTPPRNFRQPRWDGKASPGKTLLIHSEQGMGDAIQFCRFLPLIKGRAGKIVLECREPLMRLMSTLAGVDLVVEAGKPLPAFDLQAPLLSLPQILGTRSNSIPAAVPYLRADPASVELWRARRDNRFTVGLIWAGNRKPDPGRTIDLSALEPLMDVRGVRLVALQKDLEPGDAERIAARDGRLDHWGAEFLDFADTAAAIEAVDLVISIDTGPAHLAGALNRPTWVFLPFAPDWRWLMMRETSPWYPSMTLYRQEKRGDWASAISRVAADLRRRTGA